MKWISGLKPKFENQVQTRKWKTWKWEAEFQVYFKRPWLYSRWDFRDSFHKLGFHVIWCRNILKIPMVHIFYVPEPFFLKISQMRWNLDFVAICHNMLLVWLKNNNKYYGALQKRCLKVNKLKILYFSFSDLFFEVFTGNFRPFKKIWEGPSEKMI